MTEVLNVLEPARPDNFFLDGYILGNRDIEAHVKAGGDAERHFRTHGINEGRLQIAAGFFEQRAGEFGRRKFLHFKDVIDWSAGEAHFLEENERFPVAMTDRHFSRDDYVAESANAGFEPFSADIAAHPHKHYLDLGCGLRQQVFANCLYLEVYPSVTADLIVGFDCRYPIRSNSLDGIGCFAVLEHTRYPWRVAEEIHRMLKPGGVCYIDYPFLQPVHGYPSHYFNATREGLRSLFEEHFDVMSCATGLNEGPDFTVSWLLGEMVQRLPPTQRARMLEMRVADLINEKPQSAFWREILAAMPDSAIAEFACGNTLIGCKKSV